MSDPKPGAAVQMALLSDPWFVSCPPELRQALLDQAKSAELAAGERLFARGEIPFGMCCVTAGALRVGTLRADGSETLLVYVEPYQWFGEISLIDERTRTHDAIADGPTRLLLVPQRPLLAWLESRPRFWRDIARLACAKLRLSFTTLEDIARLPLDQRLAKRLWLQAHAYTEHHAPPRRLIRVPQEQLALMLASSRQSINKALRAMEARGLLLLRYGAIELLDLDALRREWPMD